MSTKYKATTTEDAYFITITTIGWVDVFNPTSAPPSFGDYNALRILGQSKQYVIHGGETTLIRP